MSLLRVVEIGWLNTWGGGGGGEMENLGNYEEIGELAWSNAGVSGN